MANPMIAGSFVGSLMRVVAAGEKLLVEQAELVKLDSRERIASVALRAGLLMLGVLALFTAWVGLLVAWVVVFDSPTLGARIALALLAQTLLGIGLLWIARGRSNDAERE